MELLLFIGIQASGKSTFYKREFFDTHIRLNLDMLRTRNRERILFEACLDSKTKVIIDNTNATKKKRERYIPRAKERRYKIVGYFFTTGIGSALQRNQNRVTKVPEIAILGTYKKLEQPSYDEGFDELYDVSIINGGFSVTPWDGNGI